MAGEPFSKLNEVDIVPNVGAVTAAEFHEIEATDGAFPKILRADETGDTVPDLYEALSRRLLKTEPRKKVASTHAATMDRVVCERAGEKGLECWANAVTSGS